MPLMQRDASRDQISQVPYLPGLDGLRALAVAAVVVYHANSSWLHGGFLGVEVFFVVSGYLITLLLIAEDERAGHVDLKSFWLRRARRLLPALFAMLVGLAIYTALFYNRARASTRGDFVAALAYVSNWFQIWVGAGYTASQSFAPLRHLWSLAVEEQFYLLWPLVMIAILRRGGRRRLPQVAAWLVGLSVLIALVTAVAFRSGDVASVCAPDQMNGYITLAGRCISVNDALYLSTFTRASGILLGAAFAMVWRPNAIMRGPLRDKSVTLDAVAAAGALLLAFMMWHTHVVESGVNFGNRYDPWLFRGGFLLTAVATLMIVAAVTHTGSLTGKALATPVLNWVGTRSYGLYLYHWPIYQIIRKEAGIPLTLPKFLLAMVFTLPITELSYRYLETPIRKGQLKVMWRRLMADGAWQRPIQIAVAAVVFLAGTAVASIAVAPTQCVTDLECSFVTTVTTTIPVDTTVAPSVVTQPGDPTTTTVAPTTSTSTTLPLADRPPVAFGESVMLSAQNQMGKRGITVIAGTADQGQAVLDNIRAERAAGRLGKTVIVQTGTNGTVEQNVYDAIMAELTESNNVIFLTVHADRSWIAGNNERIRALPDRYGNVQVVDWDAIATENPQWLTSDGIHLKNDEAIIAYTDAIVAAYT